MKYFVILLVLISLTGISFAEESSDPPIPEQEPIRIPEPEQESFVYTNCGRGTTYQDGICVVDEIENSTKISTVSSNCWGGTCM